MSKFRKRNLKTIIDVDRIAWYVMYNTDDFRAVKYFTQRRRSHG